MAVVIRIRHLIALEPDIAIVRYLRSTTASYCWRSHRRQKQNVSSIPPAVHIKSLHTRLHRLQVPATSTANTATVSVNQEQPFSSTAKTEPHVFMGRRHGYSALQRNERYIPVTRYSVLRHLALQESFLLTGEAREFEKFSQALDNATVSKYHGVLQEVKRLFDPINPDKDTIQTRVWTREERINKENLILLRLEDILERANFSEVPPDVVNQALREHTHGDGIKIIVDRDNYDVLRFWASGREAPPVHKAWYKNSRFWKMSRKWPIDNYKRLVVAIRQKKDSKLVLKLFKDVPVDALEMVLPDGKIKMNLVDRGLLSITISIAVVSVVAKFFMIFVEYNFDWSELIALLTGLISVRVWTVYKNKRNTYLVKHSQMLYFKNLANNQSLLTLLVDRAEDESYKEALLVYFFLLTSRKPVNACKPSAGLSSSELGGITQETLEKRIEDWIFSVTGISIKFQAVEAIEMLQVFGILSQVNQKLYVQPLETATSLLPETSSALLSSCSIMEDEIEDNILDNIEYLEIDKSIDKNTKI